MSLLFVLHLFLTDGGLAIPKADPDVKHWSATWFWTSFLLLLFIKLAWIEKWGACESQTKRWKSSKADLSSSFSLFLFRPLLFFAPCPRSLHLLPVLSSWSNPTHPACWNVWQMMVGGIRKKPQAKRQHAHHRGSDKQKQTPSDIPLFSAP